MDYKEVLKSVGYPEQVLVLDFECYFDSDYTITKMSTIEYICDPRFEFTGMGIATLPFEQFDKPEFITEPDLEWHIKLLQNQHSQQLEQVTVVAKNCKFDMTILAAKFNIIPPFIIDIDDLLRHYDARMSHRMKDVTEMFGLPSKGDTAQFKGLHYEDMDDTIRNNLAAYCLNDVGIERSLFTQLLPQITNPSVEIPVARHTLDLYLKPKIKFDFKKAADLKIKMLIELEQIVSATGHVKKELSGNLSFVELLQAALPENEKVPVKAGKPGKNMVKLLGKSGVIPAFAKDDLGFQELLIHSDKIVRNLCAARQAIKSWPLHIKRINNMEAQAKASGGLLRVPLHYYGAHTARWSGGEKINLQNLGGRGRGGQGTHPLIAGMRSLLGTPDGRILGIADSAQIEARVLAWFADQEDLVRGFANGEDVYSSFATGLFNSTVYKPKENEFLPLKRLLTIRRGFGKDSILGCGYTMGPTRFYLNCIANIDLRPLFKAPITTNEKELQKIMNKLTKVIKVCGIENCVIPEAGEYDEKFIAYLVLKYRTTYSQILKFWDDVEKAFKWVIKYPHEQVQVSKKYDEHGNASGFRLTFFNRKGTVHIKLPSGRELTYRHCALKQTTMGQEIRWHYGHLWGGSITENVVQACARDLLAYWILKMDKANLPIVLHSHDEIVCMLEKKVIRECSVCKSELQVACLASNPPQYEYGCSKCNWSLRAFNRGDPHEQLMQSELDLQLMLNIMYKGPEWANGLPLDAEGGLSKVYTK